MTTMKVENMNTVIKDRTGPLRVDDVAEYTGYSKSYIYRLVHEKRIAYYKISRGKSAHVYFKKEDVDKFLYKIRTYADFELTEQAEQILTNTRKRK